MTWPSVDSEELPWRSSLDGLSRGATRNVPSTYRSAVVPAIAHARLDIDADMVAQVEDATLTVKEFDLHNARHSPLLLRSESFASSQIEHLTSSARRILEAELTDLAGTNARLIVAC